MTSACPYCLASQGRSQKIQQDRPCARCGYAGNWNDWHVFTERALRHSFVVEANMAAHAISEQMIASQEHRPARPN
jgi:hypothetical protein